jgi:hypothetical protein
MISPGRDVFTDLALSGRDTRIAESELDQPLAGQSVFSMDENFPFLIHRVPDS